MVGTLNRPVHAMNLEDTLYLLEQEYPDYLVIAVDASVGMRPLEGAFLFQISILSHLVQILTAIIDQRQRQRKKPR